MGEVCREVILTGDVCLDDAVDDCADDCREERE